MKKLVIFPVLVLAAMVGCQDFRNYQAPTDAEVSGPVFSVGGEGSEGRSVVCVAYDERLGALRTELAQSPRSADLQESVKQFEQFLATQCD